MTINWGREIPVDGKRPAWLAENVRVGVGTKNSVAYGIWYGAINSDTIWYAREILGDVISIVLPADHFAYKALDAGFEPWGGGDEAPEDWDGGRVLLSNGNVVGRIMHTDQWSGFTVHGWCHIVGYRKKAEAAALHPGAPVFVNGNHAGHECKDAWAIVERGPDAFGRYDVAFHAGLTAKVSASDLSPRPVEAPVNADTVTLNRMTEAQAREHWGVDDMPAPHRDAFIDVLSMLGIIRPETDAERFERETGHEVTPAVEAALNWRQAA